jgi:hypothetical protein
MSERSSEGRTESMSSRDNSEGKKSTTARNNEAKMKR